MTRLLVGLGVMKGMLVTLREFVGTYPAGRVVLRLLGQRERDGLFTVQYPEVKQQHHERFRYFPFLVYDETPEDLRCVSCKICEVECPPQCIHIVGPAKDEQGRPHKAYGRTFPVEFDIDTSICMSCRICVDVCPFDAIEMDNNYELADVERFGTMVFDKNQLLRSNEYFKQIKPTEASVVDTRLAAKKAKAAAKSAPPPSAPPAPPSTPPPAAGGSGA